MGDYTLNVYQLSKGGLYAEYWDNIWFKDDKVVSRDKVPTKIGWGANELITEYTGDYMTVRL